MNQFYILQVTDILKYFNVLLVDVFFPPFELFKQWNLDELVIFLIAWRDKCVLYWHYIIMAKPLKSYWK